MGKNFRIDLAALFFVFPLADLALMYRWTAPPIANNADAIIDAIYSQYDSDDICDAINDFGDTNATNQKGTSLLSAATNVPFHPKVFEYLITHGANPNVRVENPLLASIKNNDVNRARSLLHAGADWKLVLIDGTTVEGAATGINPGLVTSLQGEFGPSKNPGASN